MTDPSAPDDLRVEAALTDEQRESILAESLDLGQMLDAAFALGRDSATALPVLAAGREGDSCSCGHLPHQHDVDAIPSLCMVCGGAERCDNRARAEVERLISERRAFTGRLGFGDGVTEPAASLADMIDPIEQAFSEASEYREGPRICEPCGEWLADTLCEHCGGSGCGPGTASGAYSECEWCAGVGKVHPGCVEASYTDLVTQRDEAREQLAVERGKVAAASKLADEFDEVIGFRGVATALRAALADPGQWGADDGLIHAYAAAGFVGCGLPTGGAISRQDGYTGPWRRTTTDESRVTCPDCRADRVADGGKS